MLRIFDWLTATGEAEAPGLRERLVHSAIDDTTTIAIGTLSIAVIASLAAYLSGQLWPFAWMAADIAIAGLRLAILIRASRRSTPASDWHQFAMICASIGWTLLFAVGLFGCIISNHPALIVLGAVYGVAVAGTIASRVAALPRYAGIAILLCYLPLGLGMTLSDLPGIRTLAAFVPFWTLGMIAMMRQNYQTISRMIRAETQNRRAALTDRLTGLSNRMFVEEALKAMCGGIKRGNGFAMLCLDLDGFKEINDRFGHGAGDLLLKAVAVRMENMIRGDGRVCRLGGDEFIVLLPEAEQAEAALVANRIIAAIRRPFDIGLSETVEIGVSIGSVVAPEHGDQPAVLLAAVDRALYAAKNAGKGVHRHYLAAHHIGVTKLSA